MGTEAAFSWRLLYAVFLNYNTDLYWKNFWSKLPRNADDLSLGQALKVICRALEDADVAGTEENKDECYALFVGIDEYQKVPENNVENRHPLAELLDALVDTMITNPPMVLIPMFAGTDWNKMSVAASGLSGELSANAFTTRLSLPLLDPGEVFKAVLGRGHCLEDLLKQEVFCRHLLFLGGVPRPCTQYAEACRKWQAENEKSLAGEQKEALEANFEDKFTQFFEGVYTKAPGGDALDASAAGGFTLRELVHLVAYSVVGGQVTAEERPFKKLYNMGGSDRGYLKFCQLRDGSVCILGDDRQLYLPYCFFYHLSNAIRREYQEFPETEKAFLDVLFFLRSYVDSNVFSPSNAPWQQWELFGACFAALRINALLITAGDTTNLSEIFRGLKHKLRTDHEVKLRPMRVVQTPMKYHSTMPVSIFMVDNKETKLGRGGAGGAEW